MTSAAAIAAGALSGDHIVYLGVDQFSIMGNSYIATSCTTVALHMALFLTYNDDPRGVCQLLLSEWMAYASRRWVDRFKEHNGAYEHPSTVYTRSEQPKKCLEPLTDLDIAGMSVVRRVASPTRAEFLTYGVKNALDKLAKELIENQTQCHSLSCVFVRKGASIAVVIKTDVSRNMIRIDVVDSHRRVLLHTPVPQDLPNGSAVWGRFHSTTAAAQMIEAIFPPSPSDEDLDKEEGIVQRVGETSKLPGETKKDFFLRSEHEKTPGGFFDVHVFRPVCKSRSQAERVLTS